METIEILLNVISYIDANVEEPISAETVAEFAGYSTDYFHRLFGIYTGESLVAYIRKRKMTFALKDIQTNQRLIDVAVKYGYGSERAFSRAFSSCFHMSPKQAKKSKIAIQPPLSIAPLKIDGFKGDETMDYLSEVMYKSLPEMRVASHVVISENPEDEVIGFMQGLMKKYDLPESTEQYGFDYPVSEAESEKGYRGYEYWVKLEANIDETILMKEPVEIKVVPSYKYAVIRITEPFINPFERIPKGWQTLVKWIEANSLYNRELREAKCLEQVTVENDITYMDIMIPIQRL